MDPAARLPSFQFDQRRFTAIIEMPGLTAPDKLAWWWLWCRGRGNREQFTTTADEVGARQGTLGDAGRKRLKSLIALGVIEARHEKTNGTWEILSVTDPVEYAAARQFQLREADPQRELVFDEVTTDRDTTSNPSKGGRPAADGAPLVRPFRSPADDPPPRPRLDDRSDDRLDERPDDQPPRVRAPLPSRASAHSYLSPSPLGKDVKQRASSSGRRSSDRTSADDRPTDTPPKAGAVLAQRFLKSPAEVQQLAEAEFGQIEGYAAFLLRRINDPMMFPGPCLAIARLVAEQRVSRAEVDAVLASLGKARKSRSCMANGAFKRLRIKAGDETLNPHTPRRPK